MPSERPSVSEMVMVPCLYGRWSPCQRYWARSGGMMGGRSVGAFVVWYQRKVFGVKMVKQAAEISLVTCHRAAEIDASRVRIRV